MKDTLKLTPVRQQVLEIVNSSEAPRGAYEILDDLKKVKSNAVPMTVYRALEYLQEKRLIHKIENLNAYMACSHPDNLHLCQIIICNKCHKVLESCDHDVDRIISDKTRQKGFTVQSAILEINAICDSCLNQNHI